MWPFTGTGATRTDALSLWRETNGLLRELVEVLKGAPALTSRPVPTRPTPQVPERRKLSDRDVTRSTRETIYALQQEAEAKRVHPHRVGEQTPTPPAEYRPPSSIGSTLPIQSLSDPSAAPPSAAPPSVD